MPMRLLSILFTMAYWVLPVLAGSAMAAETSTVFVEVKGKLDARTGIIQAQLSLSGQVSGKKTLWIKQRNFVFFKQTLYSGPFHLRHISPFFPYEKMSVVLKNEIGETQSIDIHPIPSQQKTLALNDAGTLKIETVVARTQTPDLVTQAQAPTVNAENAVAAANITAEEQEFDLSFINRGRGGSVNQNIIKNLNQISPGRYAVDLVLNETFIAKIDINFTRRGPDSDANACLTAQHIFQLGIKPEKLRPQALEIFKSADLTADDKDGKQTCLYINEWVENSSEKYDKGELVLAISVPQAFIKKNKQQSLPTNMLNFGETAGFTNYNFNTFQSSYQGIKNSGQFLSLDSGLNMLGWQLRQSSYASANSNSPVIYKTGDLSANRTLIDWKSRLSLGAISSQSPVIGSVPVKGIRIASEEGLLPDEERSFKPVVKGFARTNARIKVKQNTVVFFEQNIPPGPFEFTELNPVSNIGDLLVTVTESDGTEQNFIVPYSNTFGKLNKGSFRYNITAGTFRNDYLTNGSDNKTLLQSYIRYGLNDFFTPALDSLLSSNYQSFGTQLNFGTMFGSQSFNVKTSHLNEKLKSNGYQLSANFSFEPIGRLSFGSSASYQSRSYVDAFTGLSYNGTDTSLSQRAALKSSRSLYSGLNFNQFGNFNVSFSQQDTWSANRLNQNINLSYGVRILQVSLSAGLSRSKNNFGFDANNTIDTVSLNASVPLSIFDSKGSISTNFSQTGSAPVSENIYYNGTYSDDLNYSLGQSKQAQSVSQSANVSLSHPIGYSSLGLSSSQSSSLSTSFGTGGGLVFHKGGVIASQTVGDTFGIVEVPGGAGVRATGTKSTVNASGYGVVPNLSAYSMNIVDLDMSHAPLDVELESSSQRVAPVSGAIVRLKYAAITGRPLLVHFSGKKIPFGASVYSESGDELGTLGPGNRGLIRVKSDKGQLKVAWGDKPDEMCLSSYEIKAHQQALESGYTLLDLTCAR